MKYFHLFILDRPTEVVLDKAHWTDVTLDDHPHETEDMINDYVTGDYSITGGGTIHEVSEDYGTNGVFQGEATIDWKYGPDKSFIVEHDDFGAGGTFDYTNGEDSLSIALALGTLDWEADNGYWHQTITSNVKMTLHTGGHGKISNLFQLTAAATEQKTTPPYFQGIPSQQITVAGKSLDENAIAYATFQDGTSVDVTPQTSAAYYSFTVGAGKYHSYFTAYAEMPKPGHGRYDIITLWGFTAGHGWWCLSSDAPLEGLYKAGISPASLSFLNDQVGYFPLVSLTSIFTPEPGILKNPGNGGRVDAVHLFQIGFNNLKSGLDFTANLSSNHGDYSLYAWPNNCVTTTIQAAAAAGVTLPNDTTPQNLGIDLNAIPNP